jgi:hypothetical protein
MEKRKNTKLKFHRVMATPELLYGAARSQHKETIKHRRPKRNVCGKWKAALGWKNTDI